MSTPEIPQDNRQSPNWFMTTHWTVVLNASSDKEAQAAEALETLCRDYWWPINRYIRSRGYVQADADDLTQQFFTRFLEKQHYRRVQRERGRFRSFLLTSVKNFLADEWERASAQKRGGGRPDISLDELAPDQSHGHLEIADERTAEHVFEQNWVLTLLGKVRERLAAEYAAGGKAERFAQLEQFLPGEESGLTYTEAAASLGIAEGTLKSDVHRLKRRYGELLREEIAHTFGKPEDVEDEWRHLIEVAGLRRL
jgi:RNA polymerase sigma factor (sigma-70 family)